MRPSWTLPLVMLSVLVYVCLFIGLKFIKAQKRTTSGCTVITVTHGNSSSTHTDCN